MKKSCFVLIRHDFTFYFYLFIFILNLFDLFYERIYYYTFYDRCI